jgi:hypothetical protein
MPPVMICHRRPFRIRTLAFIGRPYPFCVPSEPADHSLVAALPEADRFLAAAVLAEDLFSAAAASAADRSSAAGARVDRFAEFLQHPFGGSPAA